MPRVIAVVFFESAGEPALKKSPRILFCWELGGGRGHLYRILPLARKLTARGSVVGCALPDKDHYIPANELEGLNVLAGPVLRPPPRKFSLSQNYSQNLLGNGYWHQDSLYAGLSEWLALFERFQPDIVIAEHAPTALLAARKAGLTRAVIGTGFSVPPLSSPMPGLQPWFSLPPGYLLERENVFLDTVNPVLRRIGSPVLNNVSDLFEGAARFLCAFPELDHYGFRQDEVYRGPVLYSPRQTESLWASGCDQKDIFLYLSGSNRHNGLICEALKRIGTSVLAFLPWMQEEDIVVLENCGFRVSRTPVDLFAVAKQCRFAVTQGGYNATALLLLTGVPLLLCPSHLEQQVLAYRLKKQGLAEITSYINPAPDLGSKIETLLRKTEEENSAGTLAEKYAWYDPAGQIDSLVDEFTALSGNPFRNT